ncbi:hypothetical protein B0A48_03389 [Cryoendolithus antarcticus]|uniref:UBR-type domain-containing protein n=1 Tax=Cryoendolithus antarcticus TaxID=1507870 RepID=A0A1V8TKB8_9PEZI|nr:hypothetical protein B0A48_03389 [Cryoendolithus antarcticus]
MEPSEPSQTASDYITSQLRLEADAREALPYQFDTCTKPLGPLRQLVFACLTCSPPPASIHQQFTPAGLCYSCSISCHGEHNLVELFTKRDFVCDCGTSRMANSGTSCSLRVNAETGRKGGVVGEEARVGNTYNQNYQGKFCGCGEEYDPEKEKGTMFQCLGLATEENGGCGEDWWHPECLMGLPRQQHVKSAEPANAVLETVKEEDEAAIEEATNGTVTNGEAVNIEVPRTETDEAHHHEELPLPDGFPAEDDFDHMICYKCVETQPWIKQYARTEGFLPALPAHANLEVSGVAVPAHLNGSTSDIKKRKAEDDLDDEADAKRSRSEAESFEVTPSTSASSEPVNGTSPRHASLPQAPTGQLSLFLKDDFRTHLCRCATCFPHLAAHPQLLEDEDSYEPPVSESDHQSAAGRSVNSGSILERGEAALSGMDRVKAIEGVMAYNHVRDKVKDFLKPFAESGQAVGAEDIKAYFAKLRGDEMALREAAMGAGGS